MRAHTAHERADALVVAAFRALPHLVEVRCFEDGAGSAYEVIIDAGLPWPTVVDLVRRADHRWRRIDFVPVDAIGFVGLSTTEDAPRRDACRTLWRRP